MLNRKQRRGRMKKYGTAKKLYSLEDVQRAMNIAIEIRKLSKGHLFSKTLKDRCTFCGQDMKTKKMCKFWFLSFLDRMQIALINPAYFTDDPINALWINASDEYGNVKVPLNIDNEKT